MDHKTRKTVAASLRSAAAKLQAGSALKGADLASEDKAMLKDAVVRSLNEVLTNRRVLQDLNERVDFPERFNQDAELAAITKVKVEDGKLEVTLTVGGERVVLSF